jgi:hypothetical protein
LSDGLKENVVLEEAFVISIERYIDNFPFRTAYKRAQRDLITRLHPIWLSDYIILNWNKFYTIKFNYYEYYNERRNLKQD